MPTVDFATFNKKIEANELKGIFRSSWQMDYPSIENFLVPIYAKGAWYNPTESITTTRSSTKLTSQAAAAKTPTRPTSLYQQAEALLAYRLPDSADVVPERPRRPGRRKSLM